MWTIPYLVSVLCMQWIANNKKSLLVAESDSERYAQECEDWIKLYKQELEETERTLSSEREALQGLLPSSPG